MNVGTNVVVVGLGIMGGAIAANLVASGYAVHGYDPATAACNRARARGVNIMASLQELPVDAKLILSSLPSGQALGNLVRVLSDAQVKDRVLVELSTLDLLDKESARERLRANGIGMLDSPISGTGAQAAERDLSVYVSGEPKDWKAAKGVIAAFAMRPRHVGAFGSGTRLKFVANLLVAVHNVVSAEAMAMAESAGLDLEMVVDMVREGAGNSRIFELRAPMMARRNYLPATMKLEVWEKDMSLIDQYARQNELRTPLFDACMDVYVEARKIRPAEDTAAVFEVIRAGASSKEMT